MASSSKDNGDQSKCCLKSCKSPEITVKTGRVEVQALSTKPSPAFLAVWGEDGDAMFHGECWRTLLRAPKNKELNSEEHKLVTEANKTAEYFDSEDKVKSDAKRFARMLQASSHCIAFTGAGISTAAGIGDFRGKSGKWTENDKTKQYGPQKKKAKPKKGLVYSQLRPTYTHEALSKVVATGQIKFVISQNVDGLHRLSEVPRDKLAELHGNVFQEKCEVCNKVYERPYSYRDQRVAAKEVPAKKCSGCRLNHRTGRTCEKACNGYLMNTIINFGDNLMEQTLDDAIDHARKNDLCLSLGSTLRVTPACDLVEMGKRPVRLVICNRQPTPFDELCLAKDSSGGQLGIRIFGDCDDFLREVMRCLLTEDGLKEWEDDREDRMKQYAKQRKIEE